MKEVISAGAVLYDLISPFEQLNPFLCTSIYCDFIVLIIHGVMDSSTVRDDMPMCLCRPRGKEKHRCFL